MTTKNTSSSSDWVLIGVFAFVTTLTLALLDFAPREAGANTAVVFPPWIDEKTALMRAANAGAALLRVGPYPFVIFVRPIADDYAARVRRAGALITVDARGFGGCLFKDGGAK